MSCEICKELKYTNCYADSYICKKCGRVFVVTHNNELIKKELIVKNVKTLRRNNNE